MVTFLEWLGVQFEDKNLYRRIALAYMCGLTWYVTTESFAFAHTALSAEASDLSIAAVITAIQMPITGLTALVSKLYWEGRTKRED